MKPEAPQWPSREEVVESDALVGRCGCPPAWRPELLPDLTRVAVCASCGASWEWGEVCAPEPEPEPQAPRARPRPEETF